MKKLARFLKLCLFFNVTFALSPEYRVVDTNSGQIRGIRESSFLKKVDFYSFRGIPYARAPIGQLRFKAPEPVESWAPETLDAFDYASTCVRPNILFNVIDDYAQSEDCLFLNIFVPADLQPDEKLPVMFWIHGGYFFDWSGNDNLFGPDFLIEQRVILVTLNYRLGIFGFLSLGTREYSGNMGLKDQQLALKWVHENIDQFSGDKKRITIFGESAGGSSTHLQVLSKESRKYFNNAIVMSGSAENAFAYIDEDKAISVAYKIATDLDGPKHSVDDLIEFFKLVPDKDIVNLSVANWDHKSAEKKFLPIIERNDAKSPFMLKTPFDIYESSNIDKDVIFYHTSLESVVIFEILKSQLNIYDINQNFTIELPFRGINFPINSNKYRKLAKELRQFYFGDAKIDEHVNEPYLNMLNDKIFFYDIQKSVKYHVQKSKGNTYYFQFSINSTLNLMKRGLNRSNVKGTSHCDEACYMFRGKACQPYYDEILGNKDSEDSIISLKTIETLTQLLANFAKYGNPTPNDDLIAGYHPIENDNIEILDINNDGLKVITDPKKLRYEFWDQLEKKANDNRRS